MLHLDQEVFILLLLVLATHEPESDGVHTGKMGLAEPFGQIDVIAGINLTEQITLLALQILLPVLTVVDFVKHLQQHLLLHIVDCLVPVHLHSHDHIQFFVALLVLVLPVENLAFHVFKGGVHIVVVLNILLVVGGPVLQDTVFIDAEILKIG